MILVQVIEKIPDLRRYKDDWFIQVLWDRFVPKLKKSKSEQHNSEIARKHEESSVSLFATEAVARAYA